MDRRRGCVCSCNTTDTESLKKTRTVAYGQQQFSFHVSICKQNITQQVKQRQWIVGKKKLAKRTEGPWPVAAN
jgi:hypothetical protein